MAALSSKSYTQNSWIWPKYMKQSMKSIFLLLVSVGLMACTVKLETPDKPITINMNVNVEQEVHVQVAKDVSSTIAQNPNIF